MHVLDSGGQTPFSKAGCCFIFALCQVVPMVGRASCDEFKWKRVFQCAEVQVQHNADELCGPRPNFFIGTGGLDWSRCGCEMCVAWTSGNSKAAGASSHLPVHLVQIGSLADAPSRLCSANDIAHRYLHTTCLLRTEYL